MVWLLSALGVVLLTAVAWLLGFRGAPRLDETRALEEARAVPGFRPVQALVAEGGRAALVTGQAGSRVVVLPIGDRFFARAVSADGIAAAGDGALRIALSEPTLAPVVFRFGGTVP